MKLPKLLLLSFLFFIGCDIDITGDKARARLIQEQRREDERRQSELGEYRNSMKLFISKYITLKEEYRVECSKKVEQLRVDAEQLAKVINTLMHGKTDDGKDLPYETKVLNAMRDADVNKLSKKYLFIEFTSLASGYIDQVRYALDRDAQYRKAVHDVDLMYNQLVVESKKWQSATKEQRQQEISRLKGELNQLTRRRDSILKEIGGISKGKLVLRGKRYEREYGERMYALHGKLKDVDEQLYKKRSQIDLLTNPKELHRLANETSYDTSAQQNRAIQLRREAMYDIDRRLKPEIKIHDIVLDFEKRTTIKLREELAKRILENEKELEEVNSKIRLAKEVMLEIPISSKTDLEKLKLKLKD
jgi:hypothetical protein